MQELKGRTLFIPEMDYGGARILAATFCRHGINARVVPPSSNRSLLLGGKCTSGDECYPTKVTLGNFLDILDSKLVKPEEAAFFMATADGPCRFGQYADFIKKTLEEQGYQNVPVFSLTSKDAYHGLGNGFERTAWRGIVAIDILRKLLHMTRPYEKNAGESDNVYKEAVESVCKVIERKNPPQPPFCKGGSFAIPPFSKGGRGGIKKELLFALTAAGDKFRNIPTFKKGSFPLIGIVGEIYCRLDTFANEDLIRKLESFGAEGWLAGVSEWILYTNADEIRRLKETGQRFSKKMLKALIKRHILLKDEHELLKPFEEEFSQRKECPIEKLLAYSLPYLPWFGALGEMTLSTAGAVHFQKSGCCGVIDISPFTCMNGIVSEAVYPKISKDLNNFPIKVFYFDGSATNLDRDIEIFLELARNYKGDRHPAERCLSPL